MGCIEQRAIGAVIDVEFVAAAFFHLDDQRGILGAQRPSRLRPELGRIGNRQGFEIAVDLREIVFQRRRFEAGIGAGKAAADIDDVDRHRSFGNRRAHALQRLDIGERRHRLAADMETDAQRIAVLAGSLQQRRGIGKVDTELGRQRQLGMLGGNAQANQQVDVLCAACGAHDLLQLLHRVEAEGAYAVIAISLGNGTSGFYRMHEAQGRLGQHFAHHAHLTDRGHVVMGHARIPQDTDQVRRGIRLHRIHGGAGKLLDKESCSPRRGMRAVEDHGFVRRDCADYSLGVGIAVQLKGPPER